MTSTDIIIKGKEFRNWLKGAVALFYTKQGLDDFIADEQTQFQKDLLAEVVAQKGIPANTVCNTCTTENVLSCPEQSFCSEGQICRVHDQEKLNKKPNQPCPKNLCHHIRDGIRREHRNDTPSWKNTRADKWCTDPFEITKCYMPSDGYLGINALADIDFNGTLAIIINNKRFQNKVAAPLDQPDNVYNKAREVGRLIRHATELTVQDKEIGQYIDILTDILSDPKYLATDQKAKKAVAILEQLKSNTLSINTKDIMCVVEQVIKYRNSMDTEDKKGRTWPFSQLIMDVKDALANKQTVTVAELDTIIDIEAAKFSAPRVFDISEKDKKGAIPKHGIEKYTLNIMPEISGEHILQEMKTDITVMKNREKHLTKIETEPQTGETYTSIVQDIQKLKQELTELKHHAKNEIASETEKNVTRRIVQAIKQEITETKDKSYRTTTETRMKADLIDFYRMYHDTIPISPLVEEHDVPLVHLYVEPPLTFTDVPKPQGYFSELHTPPQKHSYRDLFLRGDGELCKNIIITAEAGFGKTVFTKRICMAWCQAHNPIETLKRRFKQTDIDMMKQFEFLFMISLGDCTERGVCNLVEMIYIHIIANLHLYRNYSILLLEEILLEKRCLVILDGLDEWTHPKFCKGGCRTGHEMPHFLPRSRCSVLTTTQPWKLNFAKLNQIDRLVEINALDRSSSEKLARNALKLLTNTSSQNLTNKLEEFQTVTDSMKHDTLRYIPYIVLYMICLWVDGVQVIRSKCGIYTDIIELMLSRGVRKLRSHDLSLIEILHSHTTTDQATLPPILGSTQYCRTYNDVLYSLGKVAFETLFSSKEKSSLAFDSLVVKQNISREMLQLCLRTGLLSLRSDYSLLKTRSIFSFPHKSLQEYYAALYIHARSEFVGEHLFEMCTSLEALLAFSDVFIILCGFNSDTCQKLVHNIYAKLQKESSSQNYTKYTLLANVMPEQKLSLEILKWFQFMQTEIMQELADNKQAHVGPDIEAVNVDNKIERSSYPSLRRLIEGNRSSIKSLSVSGIPSTEELADRLDILGLNNPLGLQRLVIREALEEQNLFRFLCGSRHTLTCLGLDFGPLQANMYRLGHTLSSRCVKETLSMKYLQSLGLIGICMIHSVFEEFVLYLNGNTAMTEITLLDIKCSDHKGQCTGFTLDLCEHNLLTTLQLHDIPLTQLNISSSPLETYMCGRLPPAVSISGLEFLQTATNLLTVSVIGLSAEHLIRNVELLPNLVQLRELSLHDADLEDRALILSSDMPRLKYVWFYGVKMKCSSIRKLIASTRRLTQRVTIMLQKCTITPEEEYFHVKESQSHGVLINEEDKFTFQTNGTSSSQVEISSLMRYYQEGPLYRKPDDIYNDKDSAWKDCIQSKNAAIAKKLLQEDRLPNMDELQDAYIAFKDEHMALVKDICQKVEEKISKTDSDIVYTQVSYEPSRPDKILFVVYTSDTKDRAFDIGYPCHLRGAGECSKEGDTIIAQEKEENLTFGKAVYHDLTLCLRMHSPELMERHSNLISTSVSHFKSSKNHGLKRTPCIVLYVFAKGFIPIGEEPLPKTLTTQSKEFQTDIREGRFVSPNGGPTEEHKDLKLGCRIESSRSPGEGGTIGGFVSHPDHGLCAITCAHVVLGISEFKKLYERTTEVKYIAGIQCYQPIPPSICGEVVDIRLFSRKGDQGGMDIAFVKIAEDRHPKTEVFPDILKDDLKDKRNSCLDALLMRKLKYNHSAVIQDPRELEDGKPVVKYGFATNLTAGKTGISGTSVKLHLQGTFFTNEKKPKLETKIFKYYLHDQIEIHDDGMEFSRGGDSGSMVFITDENNKLTALGILTGRDKQGNKSYATPIWRIFEEIKSPIPYSFAEISNPLKQILERLDQYSDQISKLQKSLDDLKEGRIQTS